MFLRGQEIVGIGGGIYAHFASTNIAMKVSLSHTCPSPLKYSSYNGFLWESGPPSGSKAQVLFGLERKKCLLPPLRVPTDFWTSCQWFFFCAKSYQESIRQIGDMFVFYKYRHGWAEFWRNFSRTVVGACDVLLCLGVYYPPRSMDCPHVPRIGLRPCWFVRSRVPHRLDYLLISPLVFCFPVFEPQILAWDFVVVPKSCFLIIIMKDNLALRIVCCFEKYFWSSKIVRLFHSKTRHLQLSTMEPKLRNCDRATPTTKRGQWAWTCETEPTKPGQQSWNRDLETARLKPCDWVREAEAAPSHFTPARRKIAELNPWYWNRDCKAETKRLWPRDRPVLRDRGIRPGLGNGGYVSVARPVVFRRCVRLLSRRCTNLNPSTPMSFQCLILTIRSLLHSSIPHSCPSHAHGCTQCLRRTGAALECLLYLCGAGGVLFFFHGRCAHGSLSTFWFKTEHYIEALWCIELQWCDLPQDA